MLDLRKHDLPEGTIFRVRVLIDSVYNANELSTITRWITQLVDLLNSEILQLLHIILVRDGIYLDRECRTAFVLAMRFRVYEIVQE